MSRSPAVAGQFYEASRTKLIKSIENSFLGQFGPGKLPIINKEYTGNVLGLVSPHAGYVYSGGAASYAYDTLAGNGIPDTVVLMGPNHYGLGTSVAVSPDDEWSTPLGTLKIDTDAAAKIIEESKYAELDELAHLKEHSIEVQLPFIQYISGNKPPRIVPISIAHLTEEDAIALADDLGPAIAKALIGKSAVVIASSDLSHYISRTDAQARDSLAIEQMLKLDSRGLIEVVYGRSITMCGVIGAAVMIEACKAMGAKSARKLTYYTSGDVTGDTSQVVGYGAVSIER